MAEPVLAPPVPEPRPLWRAARGLQGLDWGATARSAFVAVAVVWWIVVAARWWGGRGAGAVTVGAILTAVAVVAARPDQVLPRRAVWMAAWLSSAAMLIPLVAPTGWAGAGAAANMISVAWTAVAVAAGVVRDRRLVDLIVVVAVAGALIEFSEGWLAWWGGEDPTRPFIGTFYWWNPLAAYLLPGTVLGLALWLRQRKVLALLGLLALIFGSIGVIYSTSRAVGACVAVAVVVVAVTQVWQTKLRAAVRLLTAVAVTAFGVWAIAGPPFFPHRVAPLAGTAARGAAQSVTQNTGYRWQFWREAWGVFERRPLTGSGFHGLSASVVGHVPPGWAVSSLAHNAYLGALSAGGLILGVPFLLACAVVGWVVVTDLVRAVRRRDFSVRRFVLPLVLGGLMAHAAVDFDWSYPANFVFAAILAGAVLGQRWADRPSVAAARRGRVTGCAVLVGIALLLLGAFEARSGDLNLNLPIASAHGASR
ncbi:MAG: O-antigen ligase family protein [Mycobacteriales bacterium]